MLFAKTIFTAAAIFLLGSNAAAVATPDNASLQTARDVPGPVIRSGCGQGVCPDFSAGYDLIIDSRYLEGARCWIRFSDCGQCQNIEVSYTDVITNIFHDTCQGKQHIGISKSRMSSRRSWYDKGGYQCWRLRLEYPCGGVTIYTPDHEIDCKDE